MSHRRIEASQPGRARRTPGPRPSRREPTGRRVDIEGLESRQLMASGVLTEYPIPQPAAVPTTITLAPDGSLWFTEDALRPGTTPGSLFAKLGRVTTSGQLTEPATLLPNDATFGLTVGPDNALWATEQGNAPGIARVDPVLDANGQATNITEYTTFAVAPGGGHQLGQITRGAPGDTASLWFTDIGNNSIGRLAVNGGAAQAIPEFSLPAGRVLGPGIAAGPAGDTGVYFTETATAGTGAFIGRIDPAGVITEAPVANAQGLAPGTPSQLVAGPDSALYFTETNAGRIGRVGVTAAGFTVNDAFFAVPPVAAQPGQAPKPAGPDSIARFADGSLLFTETFVGSVGRLTVGAGGQVGGFFQYPAFPSATGPLPGLTSDLTGNPWFTEGTNSRIGTFSLPGAALQAQPVTINGVVNQPLANIPVASFQDPDGPHASTEYRASIDWGDGTPVDANTAISPNGTASSFLVRASHTYARTGNFTAIVTITDLASPRTATASDTATISTPAGTGTPGSVVATAGTPFLGFTPSPTGGGTTPEPVATFTVDPANPGAYEATVDWGDGTALGGATITGPTTVGGVATDSVIAAHTFAADGIYNGSVTIRNPNGLLTVLPLQSTVDGFTPQGSPTIAGAATAGTPTGPLQIVVLTPTGIGAPSPDARFYSARVNWGDGTPTEPASVAASGASAVAIQTSGHIYSTPGQYRVSYTLGDAGAPSLIQGVVSEQALGFARSLAATNPSLAATSGTAGTPVDSGATISLMVANPTGLASVAPDARDYSAAIDWGDGTPATPASVANNGPDLLIGSAGHTYAAPGQYSINLVLSDAGLPGLFSTRFPANIAGLTGLPIAATGVAGRPLAPIAGPNSNPLPFGQSLPVALETVTGLPPLRAGFYSASVDYGDGTPAGFGTLAQNADGSLTVSGPNHTFAAPGFYPVTILIGTTGQPNLAVFSHLIDVTAAPIAITGVLNPASDSGISNSDAITNVTTPNFFGTTAPGALVGLYATSTAAPQLGQVQIGLVFADASGHWSVNSTPLVDGNYVINAYATDRFGVSTAATVIEPASHPLVIDTLGPKIVGFAVTDTLTGQFQAAFLDERSGLVAGQLVDGNNYTVTRPFPAARPFQNFLVSTLSATPQAGPTAPITVTGSVFNGHYLVLRGGLFVFNISSAGITDVAGNHLDGEFYGRFPTGNNAPGGDFAARVLIRGYKPSGPLPLTTANPGQPGFATISPTVLAPRLARNQQNAPPKALVGTQQSRRAAATTTAHVKRVAAVTVHPKVAVTVQHPKVAVVHAIKTPKAPTVAKVHRA